MKYRNTSLGGLLWCIATGCMALSLGPAQGTAVLGQALNLRIPVRFDASENTTLGCLEADVFHADTRQDPTRVSVRLEPASGGSTEAWVRIASSTAVDEPVVSVQLRVGCPERSSRRYVLLADLSPLVTDTLTATATPIPAAAQSVRTRTTAAQSVARVAHAAQPVVSQISAVRTPVLKAAVRSKSRLKLDPLDVLLERDPVLRASSEMLNVPPEDLQQRAQAAAWWRALNASPQETMRNEARVLRMEADIESQRAVTASNQKGLLALTERLERAQAQRYANPLVYGLAALLLGCMLLLLWLWRRLENARVQHWSRGVAGRGPDSALPTLDSEFNSVLASEPVPQPPREPLSQSMVHVDIDLLESQWPPSRPPSLLVSAATVPAPASVAMPKRPTSSPVTRVAMRAIDSEELVDLRQQVDFFMSLGQHAQAIGILTTRIAQCGESSPLLCLDLLKIYHMLGRQSDFDFMRDEFHAWFTGRVPEFADFQNEGRALESYSEVVDPIIAMWPQPRVLEYIEDRLFHRAADLQTQEFDLRAYRELLLLHGVAKRIVRLAGSDADGCASDLIRVPAGAKVVPIRESLEVVSARAVTHRAGVHMRGSRAFDKSHTADQAEGASERVVVLSAMRLPPVAPGDTPSDAPPGALKDAQPSVLTDFNFLRVN